MLITSEQNREKIIFDNELCNCRVDGKKFWNNPKFIQQVAFRWSTQSYDQSDVFSALLIWLLKTWTAKVKWLKTKPISVKSKKNWLIQH